MVFIHNFVEKEIMWDCNSVSTLIKAGDFIKIWGKDDIKEIIFKVYQQLISKLIYLSFGIKWNKFFIVKQLSKTNGDPRIGYVKTMK